MWSHCRRWKPGSCTLSAREAWFLHAVGDGSLVLARCRQGKLDHQVLLDTMVAVTRGILRSHRARSRFAAGYHGGRHSWDPPRPSSSHGGRHSWNAPRPLSSHGGRWHRARSPSAAAAGYHGGRHSWNAPRPSSSHGGRWHRARSPSAAAGYHGGRHSWNAEFSWVPLRPFDRSPPMGTVQTLDRLSLLRRCVSHRSKAFH